MTDARDDRAIQRRCEELAGDAFDKGGDDFSSRWLYDRPDKEMRELAYLAIAAVCGWDWSQGEMSRVVGRLREAYIKDSADLYRQQAEDEAREQAEIENENAAGDEGKEQAWSGR